MLDPGTLSVQEQIDVFSGAEVIIAPHGAALTNITFSRPGVRVLEMFAGAYVHLGLWTIAEAVGGVHYRYLVGGRSPRPRARNARATSTTSTSRCGGWSPRSTGCCLSRTAPQCIS